MFGVCLAMMSLFARAENDPRAYAVELTAAAQANPPQIELAWPIDLEATAYVISRKAPDATNWTEVANLPGSESSFIDSNVSAGAAHEYRVMKSSTRGFDAFGYILAGIEAPLVENRGKIILIVDATYADLLASELARLQQDLVGDGWTVIRRNVLRSGTVSSVKTLIQAQYDADPANVKAVLLFGHVPVPRSGDLMADNHPNHLGAWAADTYFADMDGAWTDTTVSDTSAERDANHNVPGDGRFDQTEIPSSLELAVGRVDLSNLTCFANKNPSRNEIDLLRQYLNKDHDFRNALITVPRRGLIADNFGEADGDAFAAIGWRSFAPMFGATNTTAVGWDEYFSAVSSDQYLWTYACGGGGYVTCAGVGNSDDFALNDLKTVFTGFFGSYFGDWDNESNFLRASLGSGNVLTTAWAGYPNWFFHRMALGEPIGESSRLSQNNAGLYERTNYGARFVHTALLGDPTLRLHSVAPPSGVVAMSSPSGMAVSWTASPDAGVLGYHVYRATEPNGTWTRLTGVPTAQTSFADSLTVPNGIYMVRAIKLEQTPSGTYYNASQGAFFPATLPFPDPPSGPGPTSRFMQVDSTTSGNWVGVYGESGNWIASVPPALPPGIRIQPQLSAEWIWDQQANREAAPFLPESTTRIASCWYGASAFTVDVSVTDGKSHRLAAYFLDWDNIGRSERVELIDVATGSILDSRTISNFQNGIYEVWEVSGDVMIRVTPISGTAVLSALFVDPVPQPNTARLVGIDTATLGNWKGIYGGEGDWVAGATAHIPTYSTVTAKSPQWMWNSNTVSTVAPYYLGNATKRVAACWYSATQLGFDFNFTDGQSHRLAAYCLDWTSSGRQQRVNIVDLDSGAVLDSQSLTNFARGVYLVWELKGHVGIRATPSAVNAVISALFFDSATPTSQSSVQFVKTDTTTVGNWKSVYGAEGNWVVGTTANLPTYATVAALSPQWIWQTQTTSSSAPQIPGSATERIAACWYSSSQLGIDFRFKDGNTHQLAAYFLDWSNSGRQQRVDLFDVNTGVVLDTRTLSSFSRGVYLVWRVSGAVSLRAAPSNVNAVVSAIYLDP